MKSSGLLNDGANNCWLNATYQSLVAIEDYRVSLHQYAQESEKTTGHDIIISDLDNILTYVAVGERVEESDEEFNLNLNGLSVLLRYFFKISKTGFEDADEFFLKLLECEFYLPTEEDVLPHYHTWDFHQRAIPQQMLKYSDSLNFLLRGLKSSIGQISRESYFCLLCKRNIRQHEAYCREFAVQFPNGSSRNSNLENWFASQETDEQITWNEDKEFEANDDDTRCQCNVERAVTKTTTHHGASNYILLQIKNDGHPRHLTAPEILTLQNRLFPDECDRTVPFRLKAVICHVPSGDVSGSKEKEIVPVGAVDDEGKKLRATRIRKCDHWIAYREVTCRRSGESVMYQFNDSIVTECNGIRSFFGARLLIYERTPRLPVDETGVIIRTQNEPPAADPFVTNKSPDSTQSSRSGLRPRDPYGRVPRLDVNRLVGEFDSPMSDIASTTKTSASSVAKALSTLNEVMSPLKPTYPLDTRLFPFHGVQWLANGRYSLKGKKGRQIELEEREFEASLKDYGSTHILKVIKQKLRRGDGKTAFVHGDSSKCETVEKNVCKGTEKMLPLSERTRCGPNAIFNVLGTSAHAEREFMKTVPQGELDSCDMKVLANRFHTSWNCNLRKVSDKKFGEESWNEYLKRQQEGKYIIAYQGHFISVDCEERLVFESFPGINLDRWRGLREDKDVVIRKIDIPVPPEPKAKKSKHQHPKSCPDKLNPIGEDVTLSDMHALDA